MSATEINFLSIIFAFLLLSSDIFTFSVAAVGISHYSSWQGRNRSGPDPDGVHRSIRKFLLDAMTRWDVANAILYDFTGIDKRDFHKMQLLRTTEKGFTLSIATVNVGKQYDLCYHHLHQQTAPNGVFLLGDSRERLDVALMEASVERLLRPPFKWVAVCYGCQNATTAAPLPDLTGFFVMATSQNVNKKVALHFAIEELHSSRAAKVVQVNPLGGWDDSRGWSADHTTPLFGFSGQLNGVPLNVRLLFSACQRHHFEELNSQCLKPAIPDKPMTHEESVLGILSKLLNFTVQASFAHKHEYGNLLPNGSFSGVLGSFLADDKLDLMAHSMEVTPVRHLTADFTSPLHYTHVGILFRKPKLIAESSYVMFLAPFSLPAWLILVVFGVAYALGLVVCQRNCSLKNKGESLARNFANSLWHLVYSQEVDDASGTPDDVTPRHSYVILLTSFGLFAAAIGAFYTAVLNTSFTLISSTYRINDVESLVRNPYYHIAMSETYLDYFRGHDYYPHLLRKLRADPRNVVAPGEVQRAIRRLATPEKFAIIDTDHLLAQIDNVCSLQFVTIKEAQVRTRSWVLPKHSPYTRIISKGITRLHNGGGMNYLSDKYTVTTRTLKNCPDEELEANEIQWHHVEALFCVLLVGLIASLAYFIFEKTKHRIYCTRWRKYREAVRGRCISADTKITQVDVGV